MCLGDWDLLLMHHMEHIWTIVMLKICKHTFYAFVLRNWTMMQFMRFIRKVFATKILLSGKFSLFFDSVRDMQHSRSDWLQPPRRTQHQDNQRGEQHKWGQQRPQLGDRHRGLRPRVYGGGRSFLQEHMLVFMLWKNSVTPSIQHSLWQAWGPVL